MRWLRFEKEGKSHYGILEGNTVAQVAGGPFTRHRRTGKTYPLRSVKLLIPVQPPTFFCAGLNYVEHIREQAAKRGEAPKIPTNPDMGYRFQSALVPHGHDVVIPRDAGEKVQYEGELVVVIGKQAKHLTEKNALDCVLGYTIGNDVSERDWQRGDRTHWRGKCCDTFKPMGPWIETDVKLETLKTTVRVNGQVTIEFPTNHMLFGVRTFIASLTKYITLMPGDVIWMGTEGSAPNLKHGDVCEIEINQIGTLKNKFVRER
ncbi:MAG: fumarylacetoacetate hydrolase family protein [Candidatus Lambdaproteobacteria bacterium]|nr:fumarylacetoacetate hydrolase family protein [Candidatus Lambdaproteobacteria bacterium]